MRAEGAGEDVHAGTRRVRNDDADQLAGPGRGRRRLREGGARAGGAEHADGEGADEPAAGIGEGVRRLLRLRAPDLALLQRRGGALQLIQDALPLRGITQAALDAGHPAVVPHDVLVRSGEGHATELHLDADEARAAGVKTGDTATITAWRSPGTKKRPLITERDVVQLARRGERVPPNAILTPSARDRAAALAILDR
jgi:hypothetical protein